MLSFHIKFGQTDRRTDRQTDNSKTICLPIFRYGGIKMKQNLSCAHVQNLKIISFIHISLGFGVTLDKALQRPSVELMKPRTQELVSCHCDIRLKWI